MTDNTLPETVITGIAQYLSVSKDLITSNSKQREVVYARELITYVLITCFEFKPPAIAPLLQKDRTTIIDIYQRILAKKEARYKNGYSVYPKAKKDIKYLINYFSPLKTPNNAQGENHP